MEGAEQGGGKAEYGPQGSFPQRRVTLGLWINAVCAAVPYRGTDNTERDQEGICFNTSFFNSFLCSSQSTSTAFHHQLWDADYLVALAGPILNSALVIMLIKLGVWCNISLESHRSAWHKEQNGLNLIWRSKNKLVEPMACIFCLKESLEFLWVKFKETFGLGAKCTVTTTSLESLHT